MGFYFSEDFLIESLKAVFSDRTTDFGKVDIHTPIIELSEIREEYAYILQIDLIDWGIHQRLFIDPDQLDELIHQSIFEIASFYKGRQPMIPRQFEEMYWIYGSIKAALFEEFSDNVARELEDEELQSYLNQIN